MIINTDAITQNILTIFLCFVIKYAILELFCKKYWC